MALGKQAGIPVVVKLHGSDLLTLDDHRGRERRTVEVLRGADGLVAVSGHLAAKVKEYGVPEQRVRVIYDGIDQSLFHPGCRREARRRLGLPAEGRIVLYIGNLVPIKGLDVLVKACASMGRGIPYTCYLIGQGPLRATLERQVRQAGLADRIRLLGPRPHAQLPDWYRAADVFVLPSRSEGVPIVLLEAAACGTPFVASRVGGIPEITHLGIHQLVPPGASAELASALHGFLDGPPRTAVPPVTSARSHADAAGEVAAYLEGILDQFAATARCSVQKCCA
jgi:glycosyltransferase involved in cell wall biosynthesis